MTQDRQPPSGTAGASGGADDARPDRDDAPAPDPTTLPPAPSPRLPDLDSLHLLLRIAATGSLGRAAAAHGLGQPAVSARVRAMERLLGVPLVARGRRGSTLTPAGALVAEWAQPLLAAAAHLETSVAALREEGEGRLRVAASLTVAEHLLPGWLVRLAADRPGTAVTLAAVNSTEVARRVLAGEADLGFVEGPGTPDGLEARTVRTDHLVLVVPPGHAWARRARRGRPVDAAELAATRLVQREPTSGTRAALAGALAAALGPGTAQAPPVLELSTSTGVRSAVEAGAGPAVLSELAVGDDVAAGRLVAVPVEGVALERRLRAVWPSGRRPRGPAQDLLAIARR
ncbi:LysR family transcriptional regulator [Cellulomonas marina]|uniref:LysR family transcriptional regulator n=1 Tax=Cellulomonas marina TaxID=988821 RepID=UPI001EF3AE81|nr:LysR family transcriptional regulator [Cellulomonas marina]